MSRSLLFAKSTLRKHFASILNFSTFVSIYNSFCSLNRKSKLFHYQTACFIYSHALQTHCLLSQLLPEILKMKMFHYSNITLGTFHSTFPLNIHIFKTSVLKSSTHISFDVQFNLIHTDFKCSMDLQDYYFL